MRLIDFQNSAGIPESDQILLLGNPRFPGKVHHLIDWYSPGGPRGMLPTRGGIIFFGRQDRSLDNLGLLRHFFSPIASQSASRYVILCGKGDYTLTREMLAEMPPNIKGIWVNSLNVTDPRAHYLPMGRDFRSRQLFATQQPRFAKEILLYCNFSLDTHPVRQIVYEHLRHRDFVQCDHMGSFLRYSLSREEFYVRLASSKFAACPRGGAIDTFRLWDCFYLGVIPIVVKEAVFHNILADLPILFIDRPEDYGRLTAPILEHTYQQMLEREWNFDKLRMSFWMTKIRKTLNENTN